MPIVGISQSYKYFNYNVDDGLPSPQVYDSYEDDKGYIWFATDRGISRFNGHVFETFASKQGLEDITNFRFFPTNDDQFWICSIGATISYWDGTQFKPFKFNKNIEHLISSQNKWFTIINIKNNQISFFFESSNFIYPDSFYKINILTGKIDKYPLSEATIGVSASLNTKFTLSKNNQFASDSDSLYFQEIRHLHNYNDNVICVFNDNDIALIGTYNGLEIYKNKLDSPPITILKNAAITSISKTKNGFLIITTLGKGVFFFPTLDIEKFNFNDPFLENEMFQKSIIIKDEIYFKSDKNIIASIDSLNKISVSSSKKNSGAAFYFTLDHLSNGQTLHYLTTYFQLIDELKFSKDALSESKYPFKKYLQRALCSAEDEVNRIWVGTNKHLYFHDLSDNDGLFQIENLPFHQKNIRISNINVDPEGIWIATLNNGLLFRFNGGQFINIDINKLLSHTIHSIFLDDKNLFIATNRGINILKYQIDGLNLKILDIKSINSAHGLLSDFILNITKWNNEIWITTDKGICHFNYNKLTINSDFPKLFIKGLFLKNKSRKTYYLTPNEVGLTIKFDAPTLIHIPPEKFRYKYRLDNSDWAFTNNSQVTYNELESGEHTFEIKCSNLNGDWSDSQKLDFHKEYPFYEKNWFRLVFALTFGFIIWTYIKSRENRLKKITQKELSYKEIELGMLRNQINPHFTFNSLNMIQNHIFANDPIKANEHLGKLSHLIRKGLELSRKKTITIREDITFIEAYLALEKERFKEKFNFIINIDPNLRKSNWNIPPLMTQPIIENILKHAFKNIKINGLIVIDYILQKDYLQITIQDNGKGFDQSKKLSKQSLGLDITKKRIKILNEINLYQSSISIQSEIGKGTTVILKLPINL